MWRRRSGVGSRGSGRVAVVALVVFLVIGCRADSHDLVTTSPDAVPSPLFDDVEQLTPEPLPTGWARCSGATLDPSRRRRQTRGPRRSAPPPQARAIRGSRSRSSLWTTTSISPPTALTPRSALPTRCCSLRGRDGMEGLLTWAFDQNLVVEACCTPAATKHLEALTLAALEATRQRAPDRCAAPESDLEREPLVRNLIGKTERLFDRAGCPIRTDIATMKIESDDHHCWPGAGFVSIGTPLGQPMDATRARLYARDPANGFGDFQVAPPDLHATLPSTATGYGLVAGRPGALDRRGRRHVRLRRHR